MAAPIPEAPPVTSVVLFSRLNMIELLQMVRDFKISTRYRFFHEKALSLKLSCVGIPSGTDVQYHPVTKYRYLSNGHSTKLEQIPVQFERRLATMNVCHSQSPVCPCFVRSVRK